MHTTLKYEKIRAHKPIGVMRTLNNKYVQYLKNFKQKEAYAKNKTNKHEDTIMNEVIQIYFLHIYIF